MNAIVFCALVAASQTNAAEAPAAEPTAAAVEAPLATQNAPKLLVLNLQNQGADQALVDKINDKLGQAALRYFKGGVVTSNQLANQANAQAKAMAEGCAQSDCMLDLSKAVAATRVVGGTVSMVGEDVLITMLSAEPGTAQDVKQNQKKVANVNEVVSYTVDQLASLLFSGKANAGPVPVYISSADISGTVSVDGTEKGQTPLTVMVEPGEHTFVVNAGGREPWSSTTTVEVGSPLSLQVELAETSLPLWPVTAVSAGVAVAGAVVFGVAGYIAKNNYDGSLPGGDPSKSYLFDEGIVDQVSLSEKQQEIEGQALVANIGAAVAAIGSAVAIGVFVTDLVINNE